MISFVGAGPGACDLITVRGMKLIEEADVIIYTGSLVDPKLLEYSKRDPEIYNSATMTLEEVTAVMERAELARKSVVRLHTGEPSLYGAVREQMDELDKRGIRYESCPGVSACFGAAATLDMEYTLPGVTQTLIITRMEGRTAVPGKESIESLAVHNASMAIYLSTGMLDELARRLIAGGYSADTPAALVCKATHPDEKTVLCTVGTLPDAAKKNGIERTAVVLVGDAVSHSRYERSKLYDPSFSTGYRNNDQNRDKF
ncbi:MAG: precorrin-4 C(11)-methyltransferase [Lachnospiraceae bacterium]|nr:precorrin-4 C(11)-methyltransferase [Lachnospiraceae bacterium]